MVEILNSLKSHQVLAEEVKVWYKAAPVDRFPIDGGACVKYKDLQIAVFNFDSGKEWYACQNLCPHKMQMILSRGLTGSCGEEPKVACPYHKRTFSLKSGECLNADEERILTFPVKVEANHVYIGFSR
ncbi:MAG: nitrite reductase small subunit NirD [Cyclobacteriaceae bacterium]|nr:nitrite reductase small subunit NirD [Cyclobacteriaceae bacterium]